MKLLFCFVVSILSATSVFPAPAKVRTMRDIPIPYVGLAAALPADAYKKLINAPVKAWIALRGQVENGFVAGAHVVHSEGNGVYDKACVQIANGMHLYTSVTDSRIPSSVIVNVLIYQLPKGEHALALAQDDSASGINNWLYSRSIRMVFLGLKK
ncbi:MAG: hypothetical protein ACXV9Q_01115 [Chthoniobacterales bacterium]